MKTLKILSINPSIKLIYPKKIPDCMASTVFFATTRSGFKIAILGNCADASCKARTERFIPGAIIPPGLYQEQ